jgi:serine/threonine-protein kinase RsbT
MAVAAEARIPIAGEQDIVLARARARELAKSLGFGMVDQSRIATAVSELARNVVRYATEGQGEALIRPLSDSSQGPGVEIVVSDEGPGMADVEEAMREGFTSGPGLGMGLPGTKRLMYHMHVDSAVGRGTTVTIRKWLRRR